MKEIGKEPIIQGSSFYFIFQKEKKRKGYNSKTVL
jgi:hypothetical protein